MITTINEFKRVNENTHPMSFDRVIPRDLFNEAKLLKCVGRLCLLIHDNNAPVEMTVEHDGSPFEVEMYSDGTLTVSNIGITIKGEVYRFKTTYNSKSNWPLFVEHEDTDIPVFDDKGDFDEEFIQLCNDI